MRGKGGGLGISPVATTVILVAAAIVAAVAVAFWESGLSVIFTRFEKIELESAYWDGERIIIVIKNSGSSPTVIDSISVNGAPCLTDLSLSVEIGQEYAISLSSCSPGSGGSIMSGGVVNEITLHSSSGKRYQVTVLVP